MAAVNVAMLGIRVAGRSPIAPLPRVALSSRAPRDRPEGQSQDGPPSESSSDARASERPGTASREQVEIQGRGTDDKDARIAWLEKEMAVMEDEFVREVQNLAEKLTNESEMTAYWQQKHSAVNQQYLKTDTDLHLLRHDISSWDKQREDKERDVKTRLSSLILDRDTLREGCHVLQQELKHKEDEISRLRSQVKGLKDFVSTNARTEAQVSDEVLGDMMQRLGNELQNWAIQNFRKAKIDLQKSREQTRDALQLLVPTYESQITTGKIHLIQSLVSRIIHDSIFASYFVGLPAERAAELQSTEKYLLSVTRSNGTVNQWRASTLVVLRNSADEVQSGIDAVVSILNAQINGILGDITDTSATDARNQGLRALLHNAIELARLLRVQKAVFRSYMPVIEAHQINMFEGERMEDVGGEDEDSLASREIRCVTFPGMIKEGNEHGEQLQMRNVISKARVLCAPE